MSDRDVTGSDVDMDVSDSSEQVNRVRFIKEVRWIVKQLESFFECFADGSAAVFIHA